MHHVPRVFLGLCVAAPLACSDDGGSASATVVSTTTFTSQPPDTGDEDTTPTSAPTEPTAAGTTTTTVGSNSATDSAGTSTTTDPTTATSTSGTTSETTTSPISSPDTGDSSGTSTSTSSTTSTDDSSGTSSTGMSCVDPVCTPNLDGIECDGELVEQCGPGSYCVDAVCTPLTPCEAAELLEGSQGCRYWAVRTDLLSGGACFAAFIANTWNTPVKIQVEYQGQQLPVAQFTKIPSGQGNGLTYEPYDANAGLPVGEVALVFLSRSNSGGLPACPATPALQQDTHVIGNGFGNAFLITTDVPVSAYQMQPYGGGSVALTAATLLLPTSVWDTNYIGANAYGGGGQAGVPLIAFVANEDGTTVTIDPKVAVQGGNGVQGGPAGVPIMYNLSRGQTLQIEQSTELTGSPIASNKPIGVFGGSTCMNVPGNVPYCEGAHQQLPPIKALGSRYVAVRYRDRVNGSVEAPPYRLIGAVDGTVLTYEPAPPPGAPAMIGLGQVAQFNASAPFIVSSQDAEHPFYASGYMTGGSQYMERGDPEWVNIIPPAQYLDQYVFFTDPTYPETELVVVRNRVDGAFADVTLKCAGILGGWQAIGPDQEWTRVDLVTGNFQDVGNCSNGRHEMSSANPFGVTIWGWGSSATGGNPYSLNVSYAYPGGASIRAINDVEVLPQ